MRRLLMLVTTFVITLSLLIIALMTVASQTNPMSTQTQELINGMSVNASQACWQELCPSKTTFADAQSKLQQLSPLVQGIKDYDHGELDWSINTDPPLVMSAIWWDMSTGSDPIPPDKPLQSLFIPSIDNLTLGDAIRLFGQPVLTTRFCGGLIDGSPFLAEINFFIYFSHGIRIKVRGIAAHFHGNGDYGYLAEINPWMKVESMNVFSADWLPIGSQYGTQIWHGFRDIEHSVNC